MKRKLRLSTYHVDGVGGRVREELFHPIAGQRLLHEVEAAGHHLDAEAVQLGDKWIWIALYLISSVLPVPVSETTGPLSVIFVLF